MNSDPKEHDVDSRLLTTPGPDAQSFEIRKLGFGTKVAFKTGPVNDKSPVEAAEANLADYSEHNDGTFILYQDGTAIASARYGLVREVTRR